MIPNASSETSDAAALQRFVDAQDPVFEHVLMELETGLKRTHWMWFVFPQLKGLGQSAMSVRYAIGSLAEAKAYWHHAVLGSRLRSCTALVNRVENRSIRQIFGQPDDMKFQSCMTLFAKATDENDIFHFALRKYFDGNEDPSTITLLSEEPPH